MTEFEYIIRTQNIKKLFSGVTALDDITFSLRKGELHALAGENGAGKSTLIKILGGIYQPTSGTLEIKGEDIKNLTPQKAKSLGISIVHQELSVIDTQTIAESFNISKISRGIGFINWKKLIKDTKEFLKTLDLSFDPNAKVGSLTLGEKQLLEIARCIYENSEIIIMDEPTSSLSEAEIDLLFKIIDKLKERHISIIYISHKLNELERIADSVTVLRDGKTTGYFTKDEIDVDKIVEKMVGKKLSLKYTAKKRNKDFSSCETMLEVKNLSSGKRVKDVSFKVRRGEIIGLFGIVGSGRTETMRSIIGIDKISGGELKYCKTCKKFSSPYDALSQGLGYISEDRRGEGLIFTFDSKQNNSLPSAIKKAFRGFWGWNEFKKEKEIMQDAKNMFRIKINSINDDVSTLSGGNQQKIVISKWFYTNSKVLILDEPTRGIDVGAKEDIYKFIFELAENGISVIIISSELPEIKMLSDRIYVFNDGKTVAEFENKNITDNQILKEATA